MLFKKKHRIRPLYKQLVKLRENVQNRTKLLRFKRKKWESLKQYYIKKLKRYKKFKPQDQTKYVITKFPNKGTSYKKRFKNKLNASRRLRLFYGGLTKRELKKQIKNYMSKKNKKFNHINLLFLEFFESRIDTVLFRAKFSISIRNAKQLIAHGKILVNNKLVKSPSYILKKGDLISINPNSQDIIVNNIKYCLKDWKDYRAKLWPIPPKYLIINYTTMEIFFNAIEITSFSTDFFFHLKLEKLLLNF